MTDQPELYQITSNDLPGDFREIAQLIGLGPTMKLLKQFGGAQLYVPKHESVTRPVRNRAIAAEFDGSNFKQLALKYKISIRQVYSVLRQEKKAAETPERVPVDDMN